MAPACLVLLFAVPWPREAIWPLQPFVFVSDETTCGKLPRALRDSWHDLDMNEIECVRCGWNWIMFEGQTEVDCPFCPREPGGYVFVT